jgi:hypothetical protein
MPNFRPSYRFEPDYTTEGRYYAHELVTWPSIFAGVAVAVSVGLLLNFVGTAIGAAAFNPFSFPADDEEMSVWAALYIIFAQFVAMQVGAYIAARAARFPDHFGGLLTGVVVWGAATVFAIVIAALGPLPANQVAMARMLELASSMREGVTGAEAADAEAAADAAATFAWLAAAFLAAGLAGAIAGGWLGAAHPKWDKRARHDFKSAGAYPTSREI